MVYTILRERILIRTVHINTGREGAPKCLMVSCVEGEGRVEGISTHYSTYSNVLAGGETINCCHISYVIPFRCPRSVNL